MKIISYQFLLSTLIILLAVYIESKIFITWNFYFPGCREMADTFGLLICLFGGLLAIKMIEEVLPSKNEQDEV